MTLQANHELRSGKNPAQYKTLMLILGIGLALFIFTAIPLSFPLVNYSLVLLKSSLKPPNEIFFTTKMPTLQSQYCDLFTGEWVPNPNAPYYTNSTCWAIHEHQNCIKYGRPDFEFLKWRWKPDGCDLPLFNPSQFLELMRDKSFAFVGDSIARNQIQSMICLLSRLEYPIDVSHTRDEYFKRWKYMSYNFTLAFFWTSHLVKSEASPKTGVFSVYLDEFDEKWTSQIAGFDYLMISSGHWFLHPLNFYENGQIVGCHDCFLSNVTELGIYYGYRKAFRTAFRAILTSENFKGITYMRTFSPPHFENGMWNQGGNCLKTKPFKSNETQMEGQVLELYMTQMEEFRKAEKEGKRKGFKFRLLDTTQAMLLRPDGHPNGFGHWPKENETVFNDCFHWCLPGPIDSWSDFLLEMVKMEGIRSAEERLKFGERNLHF